MLRGKGFSSDGDRVWNQDDLEMREQVRPGERVTLGLEVLSVHRFVHSDSDSAFHKG